MIFNIIYDIIYNIVYITQYNTIYNIPNQEQIPEISRSNALTIGMGEEFKAATKQARNCT